MAETLRSKLIGNIIKSSAKKYGDDSTVLLSSSKVTSIVKHVISTSSPDLDRILAKDINGNYGLPVGRIVGISGKEASGKTTLAIMIMREVQRMGGIAHIIETENAFDPAYAQKLGLDLGDLLISQPDYLEQALNMIRTDIDMFTEFKAKHTSDTGEDWNVPMVIVLDSIAGVPPKAEWEADSFENDQAMGLHARKLSKFFRTISKSIASEQICLICTNQLKTNTSVRYGNKDAEIGGAALKFHATLRLDIRRIAFLLNGKEKYGIDTQVMTVKNKVMVPYKTAMVPIVFGEGISYTMSMFRFLQKYGLLEKSGNSYSITFGKYEISGVGEKRFIERFKKVMNDDPERFKAKLERHIDKNINEDNVVETGPVNEVNED